jgi:hypothetical protein
MDKATSSQPREIDAQGMRLRISYALSPNKYLPRLRWGLLLLLASAVFCLGRQAGALQKEEEILRAKSIEAENFELVGPGQRKAAKLYAEPDGAARLSFYDKAGKARLIVGIDPEGTPSVSFLGEGNDVKIALSLDPRSCSPKLRMFDKDGAKISVTVDDQSGPELSVGGPNKSRVSLSVSDRSPSVRFYDENNNPRIKLSIADNEPVIEMLDQNRSIRSVWAVRKGHIAEFALADSTSKVRLRISSDANGKSSIRFFDAKGQVIKEIGE